MQLLYNSDTVVTAGVNVLRLLPNAANITPLLSLFAVESGRSAAAVQL